MKTLTLETRRPQSLGSCLFRELVPLVPDLQRWYYWTPHEIYTEGRQQLTFAIEPAPCEVPASVFEKLEGREIWSGCYKVYESEQAAIEALNRAWNQLNTEG